MYASSLLKATAQLDSSYRTDRGVSAACMTALTAIYQNGSEEHTFSRATETTPPPQDTSRDALDPPRPTAPLAELRKDVASVQHQVNQFLTSRMVKKPREE